MTPRLNAMSKRYIRCRYARGYSTCCGRQSDVPVVAADQSVLARRADRPHVACDHGVSIHAPARGATRRRCSFGRPLVFRSTPPRGGRPPSNRSAARRSSFDPRPRTGGDSSAPEASSRLIVFRSTPPHGGRLVASRQVYTDVRKFRSTPPHGGRRSSARSPASLANSFDPRPRTGGDRSMHRHDQVDANVSIHAPARGATQRGKRAARDAKSFDPRPRTGGDRIAVVDRGASSRFRSTPPHGGRRHAVAGLVRSRLMSFNPRPRTGGDRR